MAEPLADVVATGDLQGSLEALRDLLAARLDAAEPKETAALARQLSDVLTKLDGLPRSEGSVRDELAQKRADRRAKAAVPKRPRKGVVGGPGSS